jgi:crotonobetainyl-CoA:carnitine CoA-transferase CaiB-like acyl-CoA transferase
MTQDTTGKAQSAGALAGLKVIDLSRILAGPYCSQALADHGAEVVKVEPPAGDDTRDWGPPFQDGTASYYVGVNRNKRAIALDLGRPEGREVLLRLLEGADVMIENFKAGTLEKWGLSYEDVLSQRFPRLIHCRISGFGRTGPLGGLPGYDAAVQAMTGLMSINGPADGAPGSTPTRLGVPVVDLATGLNSVIGIMMALYERQRSGRGQLVEVALYDAGVSLLHPQAANHFMNGKVPQRVGNAHPNIAPYDAFETRTGGIFLAVGNDRQFALLAALLQAPDLTADPRFKTNGDRVTNRPALTEILNRLFADADAQTLADTLIEAGVPAGAVLNVAQVLAHPHTRHAGMIAEDGGYRGTGAPIKFQRTPAPPPRAPKTFGADSRAVLTEAGFASEEIDRLNADGVVPTTRRKAASATEG